MYADIGILILFWMKIIIVFASALAGLIFGILIASNKVKSTKVLGIGIIISAAASIVSNAHNFLIRYVNIEVYARYATLSSIVTLIATFAGAICTCVFIHKNYGKKFIYIPVLLLRAGLIAVNYIVSMALSKSTSLSVPTLGYWISLTNEINNLVTGIVLAVIVIGIFYKNRNTEKVIPKYWFFKIISFIISCVLAFGRMISYSVLLAAAYGTGKADLNIFAQIWSGNTELISIWSELIGALAGLIIPIYILVMVRDYSRKEDLAGAHI
ncbi:MAG: hypothetical protein IKG30_03855 [Clostridiales bacterium]|nr:hypothetical protein [Clostridiales bacterium]